MGGGSSLAGPEQSEVGPDTLKVLSLHNWKQAPKCATREYPVGYTARTADRVTACLAEAQEEGSEPNRRVQTSVVGDAKSTT
jgi:hypothetical protein